MTALPLPSTFPISSGCLPRFAERRLARKRLEHDLYN
jgi:hypothetical protein